MRIIKKYKNGDEFESKFNKDLAELSMVYPEDYKDDIILRNDGTIVVNNNPDLQLEYNSHIKSEANPLAWREEHPNLAAWGDLVATSPFIVAGIPLVGGTFAGLGTAIGNSALATRVTPLLKTPIAKGIGTGLKWINRGLTAGLAAHGTYDLSLGNFTPTTALELFPALYGASKFAGSAYNTYKTFKNSLTEGAALPLTRVSTAGDPAEIYMTFDLKVARARDEFIEALIRKNGWSRLSATAYAHAVMRGVPEVKMQKFIKDLFINKLNGVDYFGNPLPTKLRTKLDPRTIEQMKEETIARLVPKIRNKAARAKYELEAEQALNDVPVFVFSPEDYYLAGYDPEVTGAYNFVDPLLAGTLEGLRTLSMYPIGNITLRSDNPLLWAGHEARHLLDNQFPLSTEDLALLNRIFDSKYFQHSPEEKITTLFDSRERAYDVLNSLPEMKSILSQLGMSDIRELPLATRNELLETLNTIPTLQMVEFSNRYGKDFTRNLTAALETMAPMYKALLYRSLSALVKRGWKTLGSAVGGTLGVNYLDNTQKEENNKI